jgi:hypothetical protein
MNWTNILPWPLPAWYKLRVSYDKNEFSFIIEIHGLAQAYLLHMLRERTDFIQRTSDKFGIPFIFPREVGGWGFGEVLTLRNSTGGDWLIWKCPLPRDFGGDWKKIYAVAATLEIVFCFLRFFENQADYYLNQLLLVEIALRKSGTCGMEVLLSPQLTEWVAGNIQTDKNYSPVLEAMKAAYSTMIGHNRETDFRAEIADPQMIYLSVPGNACSLANDPMRSEDWEKGVRLGPHNVDSPLRLLTLLAGVFQLYLKANQGSHLLKFKDRIQKALKEGGLQVHSQGMGPDFTIISDMHGLIGGVDGELRLLELQGLFGKRGEIV